MLYEETGDTKKETPWFRPPRWVPSRYRPSAIGGGAFVLLIVGLVVWGLINTHSPEHFAAEARQEAWKFLQPWITQCGGLHYITFPGSKTQLNTPAAYYIVQIKGFELQVDASPRHTVDLEWSGVVQSHAKEARVFFSETGSWSPWSDWRQLGGVNVSVSLIKWNDRWGKSSMWKVDKYDLSPVDKAYAALSCETVAQYLTGRGPRSNDTTNAKVRNLLYIDTLQGLAKKRTLSISAIAAGSTPAYGDRWPFCCRRW